MRLIILVLLSGPLFALEPSDYLVPSSPTTVNSMDLTVSADFLYWTARNLGLSSSESHFYSGGTNSPAKGKLSGPKYEMTPGFKAGLNIILDHDGAFLDFQYTRLNMNTSGPTIQYEEDTTTLYPTFNITPTDPPLPIFYSSPSWELHFNKITVMLGRGSYIGEYTTFTPYFGLVSAIISQYYDIDYQNISAPETISEQFFNFTFKQNGVGMRIGNSGTFYAYYRKFGIGLTTDLAFSALLTKFRVLQNTTYIESKNTPSVTKLYFSNNFHAVMPTIDLLLGLKIDLPTSSKRYQSSLLIALENQVWFLGNPFTAFPPPTNNLGQLSLSGLTLQFCLSF